eukprot:1164656-Ditylum_brightwellii.AAC.1
MRFFLACPKRWLARMLIVRSRAGGDSSVLREMRLLKARGADGPLSSRVTEAICTPSLSAWTSAII